MRWIYILCAALLFNACASKKINTTAAHTDLPSPQRKMDGFTFLRLCMSGDFSSELQSQQDSDFFDIRLRMVPIWESTPQEFYLYVEQAVASTLEKPYRQRIYHVVKTSATTFTSYIYELPNDSLFRGAASTSPIFSKFSASDLTKKEGCEVVLHYNEEKGLFKGSTGATSCPSQRQGASYATSIVDITEDGMTSWDRGFDAAGKQVWGATKGGYRFDKKR